MQPQLTGFFWQSAVGVNGAFTWCRWNTLLICQLVCEFCWKFDSALCDAAFEFAVKPISCVVRVYIVRAGEQICWYIALLG